MSNEIKFHRELDEKLFLRMGYETEPYKFSFIKNGELKEIELNKKQDGELNSNNTFLQDENSEWDPDSANLIVEKKIYINNPSFLFIENGIVAPDAILGIALNWFSKSSNQRGIVKIASINRKQSENFQASFKHTFNKSQLNGDITLEIVLFLEEPAKFQSAWYASKSGTILGQLESENIIIDGTGSSFPIVEVSAVGEPLWFVTFNSLDVVNDPFTEEYVCINLNTYHKNYKYISNKKGDLNSPMLTEVLASALHIIVEKVLESNEKENVVNGLGMEEGSIGQAVYYFLTTFNWDISSPEKLASSIRRDLESRIEGE